MLASFAVRCVPVADRENEARISSVPVSRSSETLLIVACSDDCTADRVPRTVAGGEQETTPSAKTAQPRTVSPGVAPTLASASVPRRSRRPATAPIHSTVSTSVASKVASTRATATTDDAASPGTSTVSGKSDRMWAADVSATGDADSVGTR